MLEDFKHAMKIVSACLVGVNCRFDGKNKSHGELIEAFERGELVPLCPEQLGGLPTPRPPSKIIDGDGYDVLDGRARVANEGGDDVTENFIRGARKVLKIANILNVKEAVLEIINDIPDNLRTYLENYFSQTIVTCVLLYEVGVWAIFGDALVMAH